MAKAGKRSNGEADYDSTRAKKSKLSKSSRQAAQMGDVPDSEEDPGHSTSVNFSKEPAKRSHAAVSNLKNMVEEEKKRLAHLLEEKALGVTKRDHQLKDALIEVILNAQRDQTEMDEREIKEFSATTPTVPAIYQSAKSNIASSRELLGHYERASQQVASGEGVPLIESGWEKDSQTLQRILNERGEKIKLEVHQLLNEDSKSSKEQVKGEMSELDNDLCTQFAAGESQKENVEVLNGRKGEKWAVVAENAQRGVRCAVKHLPEDGE